jgi:hypothetical protein
MSKPRGRDKSAGEHAIFGDLEFDVDAFVDDMESQTDLRWRTSDRSLPAKRRLEDWLERQALRKELDDWDDIDPD